MLTSYAHAYFILEMLISCVFRLPKTCARKIHEHTRATKIHWAGLGTRLVRVKNSYRLVLHGALIVFVRGQPVTYARMPTQMDVQTIAQAAGEMVAVALPHRLQSSSDRCGYRVFKNSQPPPSPTP